MRRRKQLGPLAGEVLTSKKTLAEWVEDCFRDYWLPNLEPNTRESYLSVWSVHIRPRLGPYPLGSITSEVVDDFFAQLRAAGVGGPTQQKARAILSGLMRRAHVRGHIAYNPVREVDAPAYGERPKARPLSPLTVERIRAQLRPQDALLVGLMGYGMMRPGEAITRDWSDLRRGGRKLDVPASKKGGRARILDLLDPLADEIREHRMRTGARSGLIVPRPEIDAWTTTAWRNWRRKIYQPAAAAAGVIDDMRAYRLRGSGISLLLWEGRSVVYTAEQAGHTVAVLAEHYAGVIADLEHGDRVDAVDAIQTARAQVAAELAAHPDLRPRAAIERAIADADAERGAHRAGGRPVDANAS